MAINRVLHNQKSELIKKSISNYVDQPKEIIQKDKKTHNTPQDVEKYYEEWTDRYIEGFGQVFQALLTDNVEDLIYYIGETIGIWDGMRILDAGCGICGPAIILAKKYNIHIEAITLSDTQIKYALENISNNDLKGTINIQKADFHNLEKYFAPNEFDAVYFLESLTHSHHPEAVIRSVRNTIKDQGILYVKDLYRGPDNPAVEGEIDYPIEAIDRQFCLKIRPVGEIIDLLGQYGFELDFCRRPNVKANFDIGNQFTAKHLFKLLQNQEGTWKDRGIVFLNWLEMRAIKHY